MDGLMQLSESESRLRFLGPNCATTIKWEILYLGESNLENWKREKIELIQPVNENQPQNSGKRKSMSAEPVWSHEKCGFILLLRE